MFWIQRSPPISTDRVGCAPPLPPPAPQLTTAFMGWKILFPPQRCLRRWAQRENPVGFTKLLFIQRIPGRKLFNVADYGPVNSTGISPPSIYL